MLSPPVAIRHFCPVEPAIHPDVDLLEQRAIDWLGRFDLVEGPVSLARLIATNSAEFYARIAPRAPAERIQPAVHWCYWGFGYDDARSEAPGAGTARSVRRAAQVLRVVESRSAPAGLTDPYLLALADIRAGFGRFATDTQLRRWANAHRGWLVGVVWEASNDEHGVLPGLADYLAMRLGSCGGEPTTAMIEMANGAEVPAREMDAPLVVALTESARLVAALDNDLVSLAKEVRPGRPGQSLVNVLAWEEGCTQEQAWTRATGIRDRVMALFLRLGERLPVTASPELREYVRCLAHTIRGNLEWSLRVPRYQSADQTRPTEDHSAAPEWSERPSDPDPAPLPVPSLAWWWDLL